MTALREIMDAADIEAGAVHTIDRIRRFMENLGAQHQMVCDLALE